MARRLAREAFGHDLAERASGGSSRLRGWPRDLAETFSAVAREAREDGLPRLAASLAFYALFSLTPLLLVAIGVAGYFFGADAARGEVVAQFQAFLGRSGAEAVENLLATTGAPEKGALAALLGFVTLLFGASGVFGELQEAMNIVWDVEPRPGAGWWLFFRRRFVSFAMVLGSGFLLLVSLLLSAGFAAASRWLGTVAPTLTTVWTVLDRLLAIGVPVVFFALLYKLVPDAKVAWRDAFLGAFVTGSAFALGRIAISTYLGRSALDSTFGAAASLVVVVAWVYYSSQILFLGAELTQTLEQRRTSRTAVPLPGARRARAGSGSSGGARRAGPPGTS